MQCQTPQRSDQNPETKTRWLRRFRYVVAILLLVGGILYFTSIAFGTWQMERSIAEKRNMIRQQGEPAELSELDGFYTAVPDTENGALIYRDAHRALKQVDPDYAQQHALMERVEAASTGLPHDTELVAAISDYLKTCASLLATCDDALAFDRFRFPIDLSLGYGAQPYHLAPQRGLLRIQLLRAYHAAQIGDWDTLVHSYDCMYHLDQALAAEPLMMTQLLRTSFHTMSARSLRCILSRVELPDEVLARLIRAYPIEEKRNPIMRAYAVDRCVFTDSLFQPVILDGMPDIRELRRGANDLRRYSLQPTSAYWERRQHLLIYGYFDYVMALRDKAWPVWIERQTALESSIQELPLKDYLAYATVSYLPKTMDAFARDAATIRQIRSAFAVERYRRAHGEPPETLQALVPEFLTSTPVDPFDGNPMRYRRNGAGYIIYSVYTNLADDGGVPREKEGKNERDGDWTFSVKR